MDTKTQLMNTAETLARQRGFDAFSFADLAKTVGIRKPSVHYHFETKAALARDLIVRYHRTFNEHLVGIVEDHASPVDRLLAFIDLYRKAAADGEQLCLCASFSAGRDSLSAEALAALEGFYDDTLRWLEATYSMMDGLDARPEAHGLMALVEGAQLMARQRKDITVFDRAVGPFQTRLRQGA